MGNSVKDKVTVSLDPNLLALVDQEVRAHHASSRSALVEEAIQLWRTEQQRRAIEEGVTEYYRSRTRKEEREDRSWSRLATRQAKHL
jgi:metal-responsive CopG/Arc/MetJ family transcriptional regulator